MKLYRLTNYFWGVVLLILLVSSVLFAYISTDAPYYLSMARDISNGFLPYRDIFTSYTPVMMYLNSLLRLIVDHPPYQLYLAFQYIVIFLSIVFFYKIIRKEGLNNTIAAFLSLIFFISILSSDGTYINLEVYVIFFTLIAYYLLLLKRFFWCGFVLALGFFSKQYGIFKFLPILLLIYAYNGNSKKSIIKFVIGGTIPLILFLTYFILLGKVDPVSLISQLTGSGYDQEMIELETTMYRFLAGAKIFILSILPLFFLRINPFKDKISAILLLGILVNLIPLYIQTVSHYFILSFPFVFILMARNLELKNRSFFIVSNLVLIIVTALLVSRIAKYRDVYNEQLRVAEDTRKIYPVGSEVFLYKHYRFLYILNDYQNPVLKEVGYRYGFEPDSDFREKYDVITD